MNELLADPFIQSSLAPLILGAVLTGALRAAGGPRLAAAGVGAAFLLLYVWLIGIPAFPPPSALGKLFWAAAGGLTLAAAADLLRLPRPAVVGLPAVWLFAALYWIIGAGLSAPADQAAAALLMLAAGWTVFAPAPAGDRDCVAAATVGFSWALATGGVALIGSSASLAQLGLGLAAATGGFLLWNWPVPRYPWGAAGRVVQGLSVLLAAILTVFSTAPAVALLPALSVPFAAAAVARLPFPGNALGRALRPAAVFAAAVVPALLSLGLALLSAGGEASPY